MLVDSNTVTDPLAEFAEREGIEITHLLLTHHHYDHVVGAAKLAERFGAPILAHELTAELIDDDVAETFADGDRIESGGLTIEVIHTPGPLRRPLRARRSTAPTSSAPTSSSRARSAAPGRPGRPGSRTSSTR